MLPIRKLSLIHISTDKKIVNGLTTEGKPDLWDPNTTRYNNRDPRLKVTLFTPWDGWNDKWPNAYGGSAPSNSTLYVLKYFNPSLSSSGSFDSCLLYTSVLVPSIISVKSG